MNFHVLRSLTVFLLVWQMIVVEAKGRTTTTPKSIARATSFHERDGMGVLRKLRFMGMVLGKVQVCYNRYKQCTKLLNADFCASPTGRATFYLWARRMGSKIMKGERDDFNIKCSPRFTRAILHGPLARYVDDPVHGRFRKFDVLKNSK